MAGIATALQIQAEPVDDAAADTGRSAAVDAVAMALLRALPASFVACLCGGGDSLGLYGVKRRAARASAMHGLRQQRRDAPASKLGRRASRILAISRIAYSRTGAFPMGMFLVRIIERNGGRSVAFGYATELRQRGLAGGA